MKGKGGITIEHRGKVLNGELHLWDPPLYLDDIKRHDGLNIKVLIVEDEPEKTPDQMATFRGHITDCALESEMFGGWEREEFQYAMKCLYLCETKEVKQLNGSYKEEKIVGSLGDLGVRKMSKFIESVLNFLAENEIVVVINSELKK